MLRPILTQHMFSQKISIKTSAKIYFIALLLLSINGCTDRKFIAKQDISKITLKLSKGIDIELSKLGKSNTNFNILAKINSVENIIDANITWIVSDSNDLILINRSTELLINKKKFEIESDNFNLPSEDENYKVVFIFSGRTALEEINKTSIYYSKNQEEIDKAILELQDRANK